LCLVGKILLQDHIDTFTTGWMVQQLHDRYHYPMGDSTLRGQLKAVQKYFAKFAPALGHLWDGGQGHRGYAITPQWWQVWRIAMEIHGQDWRTISQHTRQRTNYLDNSFIDLTNR
jgi:hypothetical protein